MLVPMETGRSVNRGSESRVTGGSEQQNVETLKLMNKENSLATILEHAATVSEMDSAIFRSSSPTHMAPDVFPSLTHSTPLTAAEGIRCMPNEPKKSSAVPDIVVEHITSSPGDRRYTRHLPVVHLQTSTSPSFSSDQASIIVGRPARALSDSSAPLSFGCEDHPEMMDLSTKKVPSFSSTSAHSDATMVMSFNKPTSRSIFITLPVMPVDEQIQCVPISPRFCGPERSPKAYWLRRHSDSNLSSGPSTSSSGPRVEPYPVRSHSTGDSLVVSAMSICNPISTAVDLKLNAKELTSSLSHSVASSEQESDYVNQHQEAESESSAFHFYHRNQTKEEPAEEDHVAIQNCCECAETTSQVEIDHHANKITEEQPASENSGNKRLKLKKYLQKRYQMSQHRLQQFSEMDDVFVDRFASPAPVTTSRGLQSEGSDNDSILDVSVSRSGGATEYLLSHSEVPFRPSFSSQPWKSSLCKSKSGEILPGYKPSAESMEVRRGLVRLDEPFSIKTEPQSPGAVPRGTSVFVFPPPSIALHDSLSYSHYSRPVSAIVSQVPSPRTAGVIKYGGWTSESYGFQILKNCEQAPRRFREHLQHTDYVPECGSSRVPFDQKKESAMSVSQIMLSANPMTTAHSIGRESSAYGESISDSVDFRSSVPVSSLLKFPKRQPLVSTSDHSRWPVDSLLVAQVEGLQSFVCPVCSGSFSSCKYLTDHMSVHVARPVSPAGVSKEPEVSTGSKPAHLCPICQRTFSRGDMLTRHVRLHTGVRPYVCTLCSQVFSRSDHLTTHQRTHTGEKPYRCLVCSYAAPRRDMVTRHARIHETASCNLGSGRRGRRPHSVSGSAAEAPVVGMATMDRLGLGTDLLVHSAGRHHSESGYTSRQHWLQSGADDDSSHRRSFISSVESAEGSVSTPPITCRAWSTTSAESFESYPGAHVPGSSVSSLTADSPDVFTLQPRHFRWGSEAPSTDSAAHLDRSSTCVDVAVAGVTPVFQKCSVASPALHDQGSDISDADSS